MSIYLFIESSEVCMYVYTHTHTHTRTHTHTHTGGLAIAICQAPKVFIRVVYRTSLNSVYRIFFTQLCL